MYIYFSDHRCATQWTNAILQTVCRELGWRFSAEAAYARLPPDLDQIDFLAHVNADRRLVERLDEVDYRAFHVVRDPRDILVSSYFSDMYSHRVYSDEFAQFRELLNSTTFEEGLMLELDRRRAEYEALAQWDYHHPRIYETRFETLTADPQGEFFRVFGFLGVPLAESPMDLFTSSWALLFKKGLARIGARCSLSVLPRWWFNVILERYSFERIAGRRRGEEDQHSHYRSGVHGDWTNYLHGDIKRRFKETWGQLLIDLGYETDLSW